MASQGRIRLGVPEPMFMLKLGPSLRMFLQPDPMGGRW